MTTAVRNAAVSAVTLVAALLAGRKAGKKNGEIAAELGMKESSFNVRVTQLRKRYNEDAAKKRAEGVTVVNPFDEIDKFRANKSKNVFDTVDPALTAKLAEVDGETVESTETVAPETPVDTPEVTA